MKSPKKIYLHNYEPPHYHIQSVNLTFELDYNESLVTSVMKIKKRDSLNTPLRLHGEKLELVSIELQGAQLHSTQYEINESALVLHNLPDEFELKIVNRIFPSKNSELEGLYESGNILCTQNEPEGFRRITYFIDRPDNMTLFTTKLIGNKEKFPILLSNGNLVESGDMKDGKHFAVWHDPFPKPSYLYAVVAGDLGVIESKFRTMSGRDIELKVYCDHGNEAKSKYALEALKRAMKWDEERFEREYDLDIYMIVAVDSFNMGAMENKGLNIFNSHYVLADAQTATDDNFLSIEAVIGHEYFHNWSGNRVTCRDWFQLTLKEGLTVFRDQEFSADMHSRVLQRISDVSTLRARQFVEDASPNAHPIQPQSYMEINNFYTPTIYEKGAEVIRVLYTLMGEADFHRGMSLYFERHDAQAVTTEDFIVAHEDANGINLMQFRNWYTSVGTPQLHIKSRYEQSENRLYMEVEQVGLNNGDSAKPEPLIIPLVMGLLNSRGEDIPIKLKQSSVNQSEISRGIVLITKTKELFIFEDVYERPVLSLNRDFRAPVTLHHEQSFEDRVFVMLHDSDQFNQYEAMQQLFLHFINGLIDSYELQNELKLNENFIMAFGSILKERDMEFSFKAKILQFPSDEMVFGSRKVINAEALHSVKQFIKRELLSSHELIFKEIFYSLISNEPFSLNADEVGRRSLKNRLLSYLVSRLDNSGYAIALGQFKSATNMTERFGALALLASAPKEFSEVALSQFYEEYNQNMLVMSKYLSAIASATSDNVLSRAKELENDKVYDEKVPNLVRALVGSFSRNYRHFHANDGSGYSYIADKVIQIDKINPQIASGIARAFKDYRHLSKQSSALMKKELERIIEHNDLSKNVYEIIEQILKS